MGLPFVFHEGYHTELPPGHRFPMGKFRALHARLLREGVARPGWVCRPQVPERATLERVHSPHYLQALCAGTLPDLAMRRIGFPWSPDLIRRTHIAVGGTLLTARLALRHGLACNMAGGTHHAFAGFGTGFCLLNDMAVAARELVAGGEAARVMIVDLDVHQGDGTNVIFKGDANVFTFSLHGAKNFPGRKQPGDCDVALEDGLGDEAYLERLRAELPPVIEAFGPSLVIYDAGVDPHREDRLGRLALTDAGLAARDRWVLEHLRGRGIPVACVIGGGYSSDLDALVARHAIIHRVAREFV